MASYLLKRKAFKMYYFSTLFDENYLARGLTLYDSLKSNCEKFTLFVLCLDDATFREIKLRSEICPELKPVHITELEKTDEVLSNCRSNRSRAEYFFTISPCLPLYLIGRYDLPHICTLDADQLFYDEPRLIFDKLKNFSVIITPHKFSPEIMHAEKFGKFNVSFQIFRNDDVAIGCLKRWRAQCIHWCKDVYDESTGYFADQKYLDEWPELLGDKLLILEDSQTGIAVWNANKYKIEEREDGFYSDGRRLILYHFHGFKTLSRNWAANSFGIYHVKLTPGIASLYKDYWNRLRFHQAKLNQEDDNTVRVNSPKRFIARMAKATTGFYFQKKTGRLIYWRIPFVLRKLALLFFRE